MNFIMGLVGIILLCSFGYAVICRFPKIKQFIKSEEGFPEFFDKEFWRQTWADKGIRKRILITFVIIVVYRCLLYIPVPGIDISALDKIAESISMMSKAGGQTHVQAVDISIATGALRGFGLFTFGLMPYLAACVLLQFLGVIIRPIRKSLFAEGGARGNVVRNTVILSLLLCLGQTFYYSLSLEKMDFLGIAPVSAPGWLFRATATISFTAAFGLVLWLANFITEKGIGNGVAIIIFSDVTMRLFFAIKRIFIEISQGLYPPVYYVIISLLFVVTAGLSLYLTVWKKNIVVEINNKEARLPLRLSCMAGIPAALATAFILLPATFAVFLPYEGAQTIAGLLARGSVLYYISLAVLIICASYLYMAVLIKPEFTARLIKKYNGTVKGSSGAGKMEDVFYSGFNELTFYIALILIFFAVLPDAVMVSLRVYYTFALIFGIGVFLVFFGVLLDTFENIKSRKEMVQQNCFRTCFTTIDEMEATIKKCYLESNGISCVIEPCRFTWGIPIRTALDKYSLNVAEDKMQEAKNLLNM